MQCFERQAMYLKLYANAVVEIPGLVFDPDLLDEVLSDFAIDRFDALIALNERQRGELILRMKALTRVETRCAEDHARPRDRLESEEFPDRGSKDGSLSSNPSKSHSPVCRRRS